MLGKPLRGAPRVKKRWQLELEGELAGDSDEAPLRRIRPSRSRSPPERAKEKSDEGSDHKAPCDVEPAPKETKAYAWMDSDDEGAGSGSEGAHASNTRSRSQSPEASAVSPGEVETLPQMIRLAEDRSRIG
ncbi:unnamed protein product [Symbiodinium sp. CCMP2456]|nr:unnamed protein product [Symbiodinium sp. CCMP2456]